MNMTIQTPIRAAGKFRPFAYRCLMTLAGLAIAATSASAGYKFTRIAITGSTRVIAHGISNKDEVVGVYNFNPVQSAGFWRTNSVPPVMKYPLKDPKGDDGLTQPFSINSTRTIVGSYEVGSPTGSPYDKGFIYNGGKYSDFTVPGCADTGIFGINDNGETVGYCEAGPPADPTTAGWLNTVSAGLVVFNYPGTTGDTIAYAINKAGVVVGVYYGADLFFHGFQRDAAGNFTSLTFPGASETYAYGISDTGAITGTFNFQGGPMHGFIYQSGQFAQIDVPNAAATSIYQINKLGHFVGTYLDGANGYYYGFIAKPIAGPDVLDETGE